MKKLLAKIAITASLLTPFAVPLATQAATTWDTTGSYVVSFDGYNHDMFLTQDLSGNLTGNGGYLAGTPYTFAWMITNGTVVGDTIHITADYTLGAASTTMHMMGTIAPNGTMSGTWDDNYGGTTRNGTWLTASGTAIKTGTLSGEDFGVVNYDTGLGFLKGYTAGFGLTDATFASTTSVVVKLYAAGDVLLQTNTAILPKFNADITGTQFSSPFDVSGTFDYVTDGYWTNVRESEYGQSVPAVKVVATVTLANGKVVTATSTNLIGDPTTIYPVVVPPTTHVLTTFLSGTGSGMVSSAPVGINCGIDCSEAFATGTVVTLIPTASLGSTFAGFTGGCVGTGICMVNMSSAMSVTALFTLDPVTPPITTPTDKNQCKNGGWKTFTNPSFKNQGSCVAYTNHN